MLRKIKGSNDFKDTAKLTKHITALWKWRRWQMSCGVLWCNVSPLFVSSCGNYRSGLYCKGWSQSSYTAGFHL